MPLSRLSRNVLSLSCKMNVHTSGVLILIIIITVRHHHVNDVIARYLASAGVPVFKEPSSLNRSDRKRSDRLTLIP